jgi:DNA repair exonuclease SbcCD ATPase subunit
MSVLQNHNSFSSSLMVIDEVFDGLDANGIDSVVNLLNEIKKSKKTILIISHNHYFKQIFDESRKIILEKKDQISKLVSGGMGW